MQASKNQNQSKLLTNKVSRTLWISWQQNLTTIRIIDKESRRVVKAFKKLNQM